MYWRVCIVTYNVPVLYRTTSTPSVDCDPDLASCRLLYVFYACAIYICNVNNINKQCSMIKKGLVKGWPLAKLTTYIWSKLQQFSV